MEPLSDAYGKGPLVRNRRSAGRPPMVGAATGATDRLTLTPDPDVLRDPETAPGSSPLDS